MHSASWIAIEDQDGVPVVRFLKAGFVEETCVQTTFEQIDASLRPGEPIRLILDFSMVAIYSMDFIGRILRLHRRAAASGGLLVVCELGTDLRGTVQRNGVDRVLKIARDRREAREAFGPKE